jgi:ribose transport system substrate-binding protein
MTSRDDNKEVTSTDPAQQAREERAAGFRAETAEAVSHYRAKGLSRRELIKNAGVATLGLGAFATVLAACSSDEDPAAVADEAAAARGAGLTMFGSNCGLVATWYAQGAAVHEQWCELYGIEYTHADGELDPNKQREKVENAATSTWDIVHIDPLQSGIMLEPVVRMIEQGAAVIQGPGSIGEPDEDYGYLTWVRQSSEEMGYLVATALFNAVGNEGTVIQTQGPSAHQGARGREIGFQRALEENPGMELIADDFADWNPARSQELWESYVNRFDRIDVGYFHNDDMALAGLEALKAAGREGETKLGGADAMPEAIRAVQDGRMVATIRHSAARIHSYPVVIGLAHKIGAVSSVPKFTFVDGPLVTPENAESLIFLQDENILLI